MKSKIKKLFKKALPGIITGGADNDPSGIATYSISGAMFGFSQTWLMVLALPMLISVQSMCARLGKIRRQGLAKILKSEFSPLIAYTATAILIISNIVTIGADIIAMSASLELVTTVALKYWVLPITIFVWYLVLFNNYKIISKFLLGMVVFFLAYIFAAILARPNWSEVFQGLFSPSLAVMNKDYFIAALAILGTTITPYLFFWQVKEEVEDRISIKVAKEDAKHEDLILAPGFIFSQLIAIFIIIATGATLFQSGVEIKTAADAARALAPVAGPAASWLFALGIIGAGLLALPILSASTAYVVAESFGWKHESINNKVWHAKGFYAVITLSLLAGVGLLIADIDPIKSLYYSQVLAGTLAPFLLVLILILANRKKLMGNFRNGWFDNFFGTLAILVLSISALLAFFL
jgi:NRAMP (natural resistance-associated macrophage protein)-like metal ion transporter